MDKVKTIEYEIKALKYFFRMNHDRLIQNCIEVIAELQKAQDSFSSKILEVKINFQKFQGVQRPQSLQALWKLKDNKILEKIIDRKFKQKAFQSLEEFDHELQIVLKDSLTRFVRKCQNYTHENKIFSLSEIKRFAKDYEFKNFERDIKKLVRFVCQRDQRQSLIKDLSLLTQDIGDIVRSISEQHKIERILRAITALKIENPEEEKQRESLMLLQQAIKKNERIDQVLPQIKPLTLLLAQLQDEHDPSIDRFINILSASGDLFNYLDDCSGLNFQDILDVIDETSLEADTLVSQIIRVQSFFNKVVVQPGTSNLPPIKRFLAIYKKCPIQEVFEEIQYCNHSLNHIRSKIEEQLNLSGRTLQRIEDFSKVTEVVALRNDREIELTFTCFPTPFKMQSSANQSIYDFPRQNSEKFSSEKFNLLINKGLMLSAQRFARNDDNENAIQKERKVNILRELYNIAVDFKYLLQELYNYGYMDEIESKYTFRSTSRKAFKEIRSLFKKMYETRITWIGHLREQRKYFYSLNLVSPIYFQTLLQSLKSSSWEGASKVVSILKNLQVNPKKTLSFKVQDFQEDIKDPYYRLKTLGKALDRVLQIQFKTSPHKAVMERVQALEQRGFLIVRVKGGEKVWQSILSIFAYFGQFPTFHQVLFCSPKTEEHEIEQFLQRAIFFLSREQEIKPIYLMAGFEQLPLSLQVQAKAQIDRFNCTNYSSQKGQRVKIVIMYEAKELWKAHVIDDLKNPMSPPSLEEEIFRKICRSVNSRVTLVHSSRAGLGKSHWIRKQAQLSNRVLLQIPLYGQFSKSALIELIQQKRKKVDRDRLDVHLNVCEMRVESVHTILFEILILHKLQVGHRLFSSFSNETHFYVEVANTPGNSLMKGLSYLTQFNNPHYIQDLNEYNIDFAEDPESVEQYALRYLSSMDELSLAKQQDPNDGKCMEQYLEAELLRKHFLDEVKMANFFQLKAFLQFFGRQVSILHQSPYLSIQGLQFQEIDPNFRQVVVENLAQLALNFASQVHKNESEEDSKKIEDMEEKEVRKMENIRLWEEDNGFLLAFNSDNTSIRLFYKSLNEAVVPQDFIHYFRKLKFHFIEHSDEYALKEFDQYTQKELRQILLRLCADPDREQKERVRYQLITKFKDIVLTKDNVIKMAVIFLRIKSGVPVLIMGETGVGKTILIKYLSTLIQGNIEILNVHPGLSQQDIADWVKIKCRDYKEQQKDLREEVKEGLNDERFQEELKEDRKSEHRQQEKCQVGGKFERKKLVLFLDEVNTNPNIDGILKEILVDRRLMGDPLPDFVVPVAAANPFKLRKGKTDALTKGLKIQGLTSSKLVYLVKPLPQSMLSSVWNFGSLLPDDEFKYIQKIVDKLVMQYPDLEKWSKSLALAIQTAQNFMRERQEVFAVSLRDMARLVKVFRYFTIEGHSMFDSVVLSFFFCYYSRLDESAVRAEFVNQMQRVSQLFKSFYITRDQALNELGDSLEKEDCIALNMPLKENVFLIIVSIECNIPIILTGPPGSSKTLATRLVYKNMKGQQSKNQYFKNKPKLILKSYQCSELSTSDGISNTFERAIETQKKFPNHRVVIILDEIGLAEKSKSNPLKVLHSLLEPPQVAVIGLSNWSLDAAKMNRAVHASRPMLSAIDLRETAISIKRSINKKVNSKLLKMLADDFFNYLAEISRTGSFYFHGTRDFYNLVYQVCSGWSKREGAGNSGGDWVTPVMRALLRNFGGKPKIEDALYYFKETLLGTNYQEHLVDSSQLVWDNLRDTNCRNLMLITESPEQAIAHLESLAAKQERDLKVFYGSDFEEDVTEARSYQIIFEVIHCMEQGTCCVFFGLDHIYQSFYDLLNQNYSEIHGKKICRIAIASDNFKAVVHPQFKAILIVRDYDVYQRRKFDPPLLNRFEKQRFNLQEIFSAQDKIIYGKLTEWLEGITKIETFSVKDSIPTYTDDTVASIILQHKDEENSFQACQKSLLWLFSLDGALRASKNEPEVLDAFFNDLSHRNLDNLFVYCDKFDQRVSWKDKGGFKLLVYSPDMLIMSELRLEELKYYRLQLSALISERNLNTELQKFFYTKEYSLLVVVANVKEDSRERILLVKNRISSLRAEYMKKERKPATKNIIFQIRTVDKQTDGINADSGWLSVQLETMSKLKKIESIKFLMNPLDTVLEDQLITRLFEESLAKAMGQLTYPAKILNKFPKRVKLYSSLFQLAFQETEFREWLRISTKEMYAQIRYLESEQWYMKVAMSPQILRRHNQFHKALRASLIQNFASLMAKFLYVGEKENIITSFRKEREFLDSLFFKLVLPLWIKKTSAVINQPSKTDLRGQNLKLTFPFLDSLYFEVLKLRTQFSKDQNSQLWIKLAKLNQQLEIVIDPDYVKLLPQEPQLFMQNLMMLPQFRSSRNPVAYNILQELLEIYEVKNNCEIVGLFWEFQTFFNQMDDIWKFIPEQKKRVIRYFDLQEFKKKLKELKATEQESKEIKEQIKTQEDEETELKDSKIIKQELMNWTLKVLIRRTLFEPQFFKMIEDQRQSWSSTVDNIRAQFFNIMDYSSLEADMDLIKNLEFYLELSQFMEQSYENLRKVYDFFGDRHSFNKKVQNYENFFQTLIFLTSLCNSEAQVQLKLYLFRKALIMSLKIGKLEESMLEAALTELEVTISSSSPQNYGKVLLMVKRILKILAQGMPFSLDKNLEDSQVFQQLSRSEYLRKLPLQNQFIVMVVDVIEETYYNQAILEQFLGGENNEDKEFKFKQITSLLKRLIQKNQNQVFLYFGIALYRATTKLILPVLVEQKQKYKEELLDTLNALTQNWSQKDKMPFMIYLARALKNNQNFRTFSGIQEKVNLFAIQNLNFEEYELRQSYPWERSESVTSKQEKEIIDCFKQDTVPEFMLLQGALNNPISQYTLLIIALNQQIFYQRPKYANKYTSSIIDHLLKERREMIRLNLFSRQLRPQELQDLNNPHLLASLYLIMSTVLVLPSKSFPLQLLKEGALEETYIPFMIGSDQNVYMEAAFLTSATLTRYRCTGCQKFIVWVGGCGEINHDFTIQGYKNQGITPRCPICKTIIGHTEYGDPHNLERLDAMPVPQQQKEKLRVTDPGYQEQRPEIAGLIRGIGGVPLRVGRFYYLAYVYLLRNFIAQKDEGVREQTQKVLADLLYEWNALQEISGYSNEELMTLFYYTVKQHVKMYHKFEGLSLSRSKDEAALQNRTKLERSFVKYCVPNKEKFRTFSESLNKLDYFSSLLIEGGEESLKIPRMRELQGHLRMQREADLERFKVKLYENPESVESEIWDIILNHDTLQSEAGALKSVSTWLKYTKDRLFQKITRKDANEMTVAQFCKNYGGQREFQEMKEVWDSFTGKSFNPECEEIKLEELSYQQTRIMIFCLSDNADQRGYATWLFLKYLVNSHNKLHSLLSSVEGSKIISSSIQKQEKRLFGKEQVKFFSRIQLKEEDESEEYALMDQEARRFGVNDVRVGRGRELYFEAEEITAQLMGRFFNKIGRIKENEDYNFQFQGDVDVGNKIGDVKDKISQESIPPDKIETIKLRLESNDQKFELLQKVDIALDLLQPSGGNKEISLLKYFEGFRIKAGSIKLDDIGLQLKHIVNLYQILEAELFQLLEKETNAQYQMELTQDQRSIAKKFYTKERESVEEFQMVLARFCVRHLRFNPRMNKESELYSIIFDENGTFQDLWGVGKEKRFVEMKKMNWNSKYSIFQSRNDQCLLLRQVCDLSMELKKCVAAEKEKEEQARKKKEKEYLRIEQEERKAQGKFSKQKKRNMKYKKRGD